MNSYWQRRWLVLDQEKLYFIDENITNKIQSSLGGAAQSQLEAQTICDLMLCNVKERPVADIRYCFEIAYANVKTFTFQVISQVILI